MTFDIKQLEALATLEKWFSNMHDLLYNEHSNFRSQDGFYSAMLEARMGMLDLAWVKYNVFLQELGIKDKQVKQWRIK